MISLTHTFIYMNAHFPMSYIKGAQIVSRLSYHNIFWYVITYVVSCYIISVWDGPFKIRTIFWTRVLNLNLQNGKSLYSLISGFYRLFILALCIYFCIDCTMYIYCVNIFRINFFKIVSRPSTLRLKKNKLTSSLHTTCKCIF